MRAIILAAAAVLASQSAGAVTCFLKGEQVSGMNKICYYDCLGSAAAITQSAVSLCALSINHAKPEEPIMPVKAWVPKARPVKI